MLKKYSILIVILCLCFSLYLIEALLSNHPAPRCTKDKAVPARVISINPAATEFIFELGRQDLLVAVSDFCNYPPQVDSFPKVGGTENPNLERIRALNPDLIIVQGQSDAITDFCQRNEIECIPVNLRDINEIYEDIVQLGVTLGCKDVAAELNKRIQSEIKTVTDKLAVSEKRKVFFSLYRTPGSLASITTAGPNTLLSELITFAGGTNIFNDVSRDYPVISKETLLKRQPDIIIEPYQPSLVSGDYTAEALNDWSKFSGLEAVQNNAVYFIDSDLALKPGPRIGQAAIALAELIHPELFND